MSAKVPSVVRLAKEGLAEEKCVVIGLQSTGEARTEEAITKYVCLLSNSCFFSIRSCGFYNPAKLVHDPIFCFLILKY
jgi:hypothetical protein